MEKKVVVKLQGAGIYHADNPNVTLTPRTRDKSGEKVLENIDLEVCAGEVQYRCLDCALSAFGGFKSCDSLFL